VVGVVKIKILNEKGHEELEMPKSRASAYIEEQIHSGKWAFIDGMFQPKVEKLREDAEVIITVKLMGG
jgi:hypothetical protein